MTNKKENKKTYTIKGINKKNNKKPEKKGFMSFFSLIIIAVIILSLLPYLQEW